MQKNIPLKISLQSEYFDLQSGEKYDEISQKTTGCFQKRDDGYRLLYKDGSKESDIYTELIYCFEQNEIIIKKKGDVECELLFSKEKECSALYRLSSFSFDAHIKTHELSSSIDESGGEIKLLYTINLGGQEQKISMQIFAEA